MHIGLDNNNVQAGSTQYIQNWCKKRCLYHLVDITNISISISIQHRQQMSLKVRPVK